MHSIKKSQFQQFLCLFFYLLCYAAVLKFLTYYAQYYAHVKDLCLKSDCSIRVYSLGINKIFNMVTVLRIISVVEHNYEHNGAVLKSVIGSFKSTIGSSPVSILL